jgi:hypothetical protein
MPLKAMRRVSLKSFMLIVILALGMITSAQDKPRVFITTPDQRHSSSEVTTSGQQTQGVTETNSLVGQPELVKTLNQACPEVIITNEQTKADYVVVWDHKTWRQTSWTGHQNDIAIYNRAGDLISSAASQKMPSIAKDACKAIVKDVNSKRAQVAP